MPTLNRPRLLLQNVSQIFLTQYQIPWTGVLVGRYMEMHVLVDLVSELYVMVSLATLEKWTGSVGIREIMGDRGLSCWYGAFRFSS